MYDDYYDVSDDEENVQDKSNSVLDYSGASYETIEIARRSSEDSGSSHESHGPNWSRTQRFENEKTFYAWFNKNEKSIWNKYAFLIIF